MTNLLLGYDIGSSSIKATLMEAETGNVIASATSPKKELEIIVQRPGLAEQNPETWWEHVKLATRELQEKVGDEINLKNEEVSIGISYQMHGLVIVDNQKRLLRNSIIWCDSRAVEIGMKALRDIGPELCLEHMLNSPGNFTASKLKWVKDNEPDIYKHIHKAMLPGDYIAMKMTDKIVTTPSGLSEGIMWDFKNKSISCMVLSNYGISGDLIPDIVDTFSIQGELTKAAAEELGLKAGSKISYRAGDQPNNALSLNVLNPGEVAATAGTSGVVYGVSDKMDYDKQSRVNTFAHVNYSPENPMYGVLLCLNGCGILNSWLKHQMMEEGKDYPQMNELASQVPIGSEGLVMLPYGNGAERTLENRNIGASVHGWNLSIHKKQHFLRAAQEAIVFALNYGLEIMKDVGVSPEKIRAGNANMFLSPLFCEAFANTTGAEVTLYNTDGSQGAARGAGLGAGIYLLLEGMFFGLEPVNVVEPTKALKGPYQEAYQQWKDTLRSNLQYAGRKPTHIVDMHMGR